MLEKFLLVFLLSFFFVPVVLPQDPDWTWKDRSGTVRTQAELETLLAHHQAWMNTNLKPSQEDPSPPFPFLDLFGSDLSDADLRWKYLLRLNLTGVILERANLEGATLEGANLFAANLEGANLRGSDLFRADLREANLAGAMVDNSRLDQAKNLSRVIGLEFLRVVEDLETMERVKKIFVDSNLRKQERQITYAINAYANQRHINNSQIELWLRRILFEWTCKWGLAPSRCIGIILWGILFFGVFYIFGQRRQGYKNYGIWKVWAADRISTQFGSNEPERIQPRHWHKRILWALYFSILSSVHFGWRDLNVGSWIARIQPREYALRANGWVRMVSGIQSLLSVYLLALWALTYFGMPFR